MSPSAPSLQCSTSRDFTFPLRRMLRDFPYELGELIPASTTPRSVQGADVACSLLILRLSIRVSMHSRTSQVIGRTVIVARHGGGRGERKRLPSARIATEYTSAHLRFKGQVGAKEKRGTSCLGLLHVNRSLRCTPRQNLTNEMNTNFFSSTGDSSL